MTAHSRQERTVNTTRQSLVPTHEKDYLRSWSVTKVLESAVRKIQNEPDCAAYLSFPKKKKTQLCHF